MQMAQTNALTEETIFFHNRMLKRVRGGYQGNLFEFDNLLANYH